MTDGQTLSFRVGALLRMIVYTSGERVCPLDLWMQTSEMISPNFLPSNE